MYVCMCMHLLEYFFAPRLESMSSSIQVSAYDGVVLKTEVGHVEIDTYQNLVLGADNQVGSP